MDPEKSPVSVKDDVKPSSSMDQRSFVVSAGGSSDGKDSILVEKVQDIALDSGKTATIHLTARNKAGIFEEEEEGELDYEEDEGEIVTAQEDKNGVKNDTEADDKEEGELEEGDEQGEEGEEGEILSDEETKDNAEKKPQEKKDLTNEGDGPEEGEVIEDGDTTGSLNLRKKVCRYFTYGGCTWGMSCRFLHPGLNDKGAYQMLPVPGQYPSPFPKPAAVVPPVHPDPMMPSFPDKEMAQMDEDMAADRTHPISEPTAPPKKETAWERGLKLAKEIKKAAQKRKEEDADFEEKRMILGITAEGDEDENDKENMIRRREMMRNRLDKGSMFYEEEDRNRRGGDIVTRWRDKRDTSPVVHHRDRERRKKRAHRTPSSSPERDRRSRRRGGEKEKQKEKTKEISKEREKERTRKPDKEKAGEDKVKKKKDKSKEIPEAGKNDSEVKQETGAEETEQTTSALKDPKKDTTEEKKNKDEDNKKRIQEMSAVTKTTKETEKKEDVREIGGEEKDKYKPKALGISSSRLPNDEWIDPWQRTTSPKRHSVSSRSSRSRTSSSSSNSSRSSRSRSHSGSESRSTSRSASRSRSRSVSPTSSRSRSRSGSRSKSRSRSGSRSSRSDRSSSTSSNSPARDAKTVQAEDKAQTHSGSESESNKPPVQKSPTKLKSPADNTGPQTPPVEPDRNIKENRNRIEYGQADRIDKPSGSGGWGRRGGGVRPLEEPYSRQRGHHSRRGRSPDRRKRSRSPRGRNEDRRRADQSKTRERSSSADSMEHALARPSSPRTTRERGGGRHGSSASSSSSESSDTGSESEDEQHPAKTRRAAPRTEQLKQAQNVPLTSGNIRYTGHKDIKLTLNKSVARTDNTNSSNPSQHSPPSRSEANSSTDKQADSKKRPRDPSPVPDAAVITAKEAVSSSVTPTNKPEKRSADSPAEQVSSGKSNNPNTSSRREELLRELKAVEDAIARKRARIE